MKRKLTLTVEESVIEYGKKHAKERGKSLSQLVEEKLRELEQQKERPFSERWAGCIEIADRPGDRRLEYLKEHYK